MCQVTPDSSTIVTTEFENLYIALRREEGRLYSDEEVLHLPYIAKNHVLYKEWKMRKESCTRLIHYLKKKQSSLKIWEPCCGNGWLSARLAGIQGSQVMGSDINTVELEQAKNVFAHVKNLLFQPMDCGEIKNTKQSYEIIVLASCIQYFEKPVSIIRSLLSCLKSGGELHILDSPLYKHKEIGEAMLRSTAYFHSRGLPGLDKYYYHHSVDLLKTFNYNFLYQPSFFQRLRNKKNPFQWILIKNN